MRKSLILAATILSLGAGAALAGDGDVGGLPAQVSNATATAQTSQHRLFSASTQPQVSVYQAFNGGYAQGGQR